MRKQGWPYPRNPSILTQESGAVVINYGQKFGDSLTFIPESTQKGAILGEFVSPGQQLKILMQGEGLPTINTWAIVLKVRKTAVKVLRQDGSEDVFLRNDPQVRSESYPYAVGDAVWYNVYTQPLKSGTIQTVVTDARSGEITSFTVSDSETGEIVEVPLSFALIKMDLPQNKPQYESFYNV